MRKSILAIFAVLLMLGSLIVLTTNVSACHNLAVTCTPTEKDITDINTWKVKYEIDMKLTPGCSNQYWVGFTVTTPPARFHCKLYEKDDPLKTKIDGPTAPTSPDHNLWAYWISVGSGSEVHFYAILEVWCDVGLENGQQATITVDCYSCDGVPNDLEHRVVTTITTVNVPNGIIMKHAVPIKATQWVRPYEWAEFDIVIEDIGEAFGLIDLSKDPMSSLEFEDNWDWEFSENPVTLPMDGTVGFKLKVRPPQDAADGSFTRFIVKGVNRDNATYKHTLVAKTIVSLPKPDLSVRPDTGIDTITFLSDDPCDGESINISIDIYNLGDIAASNFEVFFKLTTIGMEGLIEKRLITETINPGEYLNFQSPWKAIEGEHALCIHLDEDKKVPEKEEDSNNEAGILVTISPPKPKYMVLTMSMDTKSCMPESGFTVTGKANYNPEYNSLPVKNANVKVKIVEKDTLFNAKTDTKGEYSVTCTAPNEPDTYTIEVSVSDGSITGKAKDYLTVATFSITVNVIPGTAIVGEEVTINGFVTEYDETGISSGFPIKDADVTIKILDQNDVVKLESTVKTDTSGVYTEKIEAPEVSEYSEFKVDVTATKNEITGLQESKLFVDIDTDKDTIGNEIDTDDDGDNYPDSLEELYGYDSLDINDKPTPIADAGSDQTVDEGVEVSFNDGDSYSPAGLDLLYAWDFSDGSKASTSEAPVHLFDSDGEYIVTLVVSDEYGGSDSDIVKITVNDLGPTAKLTGPSTGDTSIELTYSAEESTYAQDLITKYEWDWNGDGTFDSETTTATTKYTWSDAGTYTVKLRITDNDGSTDTSTLTVTISPGPGSGDEKDSGKGTSADYTAAYAGIVIQPTEQRVAANVGAQASRRPTTQFAEADIKPTLTPPGTVPARQISTPVQQMSALPPAPAPKQQPPQPQVAPQEQRDWNWNFNE
jgi:PKD repeat protein